MWCEPLHVSCYSSNRDAVIVSQNQDQYQYLYVAIQYQYQCQYQYQYQYQSTTCGAAAATPLFLDQATNRDDAIVRLCITVALILFIFEGFTFI